MKITEVQPDSLAEELGLQVGDQLLRINGNRIKDIIDYRFHFTEDEIEMVIFRDNERMTIEKFPKHPDEQLGVTFEPIKIRKCANDCLFCFVDQNPEEVRDLLKFRDGDYRLSFLQGHYVTLTNVGWKGMERIATQGLSPIYVSVHVTDPEVRKELILYKKEDEILEKLDYLVSNNIEVHTQIVLVPGVNDGEVLDKTLEDLYQFREKLMSVAVVPVGLTKHREGLAELESVSPEYAKEFMPKVRKYDEIYRNADGDRFVYLSDEWFILADEDIPAMDYYGDAYQIENGVGLVRSFLDDFAEQAKDFPESLPDPRKVSLVTGKLAEPIFRRHIMPTLNRIGNFQANLYAIRNDFWGEMVTVAGLLTAQDVIRQLAAKNLGDALYLPMRIINDDGITLDDKTPEDIQHHLGVPTFVTDEDFHKIITGSHKRKQQYKSTSVAVEVMSKTGLTG
ncbi:MAG: hypothetical protein MAGBODY4_01183 [Candidatus Marinimicrobia bacterium]|nr:hypothetical protein [Candidatus Neomarinimicrobiota bacterium]